MRPALTMEPDEISPRQSAARQLPNLGLAVLGLLVTHETAYALAAWLRPLLAGDGGATVDHAHQSLLLATAGPLALWLTAWFVLRQLRNLSLTTIWGPTPLSLAVAGMYLAQETVEVLTAGPAGPGLGGLVGNRAVVIGLLLVPLVARLLLRALDRAEELIQAWLATPSGIAVGQSSSVPLAPSVAVPSSIAHQPGDPRGPPVRDVTTR